MGCDTYKERSNPKREINSPCIDDVSVGRNKGDHGPLKKGPWTSVEDAILIEYVTKHGEGNWKAVQKNSGLSRCGKSCRFRWANHLRPDLKKSAFSPEEERQIVQFHAKMGNKWARMAAELPGRTDNEIKNYWNTRIKRRQRDGLPIYPPDVCLQVLNENQQKELKFPVSSDNIHYPDFHSVDNIEFPALDLEAVEELDHQLLYQLELLNSHANTLLNVPASSLLMQGYDSSYADDFLLSTIYPSNDFQRSDFLFPKLNSAAVNALPELNDSMQIYFPSEVSPVYDPYPTIYYTSSSGAISGSHAMINGNIRSSEPTCALKPELPSLQNYKGSWGSSFSLLPSIEAIDTSIQTPLENAHLYSRSPQNSGLLDDVLYESQRMKLKNTFHQTTSHDEPMEEYKPFSDTSFPLCHSSSSAFSKCPPACGSASCDDLCSMATSVSVKDEAASDHLDLLKYDKTTEKTNRMICSPPDFALGSNFFCI